MDARKGNIYEILNGNKQFIIPVYQRRYSWEKKQCKRLWDDIVNMQNEDREGHFVGSIVNIAEQAMPTGVQKFMIIDGQQRITTLTLLLIALRNYANHNPKISEINARRIDNVLLKNEYESGDERYKLLLTETDRDLLLNLIQDIPFPDNTTSNLIDNYKYFEEKIRSKELSPDKIYESIGKLQIVNITLDRTIDDAQAIFESLNSTGKELSESDLIRNYVLMGLEQEEQTYVYEHLWMPMETMFQYETQDSTMDRFFRDYLTMKLARIPNQNKVYEEFKLYHLNSGFSSIRECCEDLLKFAKYFTDMFYIRSGNVTLKRLYQEISDLRMEVSYPFLLKIHQDHDEGIISEEEFLEIINICISYVFRRSICNIPTNSLNKTFATLRNAIKQNDYLNSIKAFFVLRENYKEFPNDDKFEQAFITKDIYSMRTRNYIFGRLENHGNKAPIVIENFTVEHVMPQNNNLSTEWQNMLGDDWAEIQKTHLHTIGNLTLTAYNSEMSDRPFIVKMDMEGGFKESALRLNSYIVKQEKWTKDTILERAQLLARKAMDIWRYPEISEQNLLAYKGKITAEKSYNFSIYDTNEFTRELFDLLDKRILSLSPHVKREYLKQYVAYKLDTNFVDVSFQKRRLILTINMKFDQVHDPNGICEDISDIGRWGNGDVRVYLEATSEVSNVMDVIVQSFQLQAEE